MKFVLIIIGLFAFSQVDAKKKYYKWTDADGNIHYSSSKPLNGKAEEVKVATSEPAKVKIMEHDGTEDKDNSEEERTPQQKAVDDYNQEAKEKALATQNRENCKIARKNLATLQQTTRIRKTNPATGEVIRVDDTQRIKMMKDVRESIKKLCK